jgi:hypothetical protein
LTSRQLEYYFTASFNQQLHEAAQEPFVLADYFCASVAASDNWQRSVFRTT